MVDKLRVIDGVTGEKKLVDFPDSLVPANVVLSDVNCYESVYIGAAVYIESGTNKATNAIATSSNTSNVIGIVEAKSTTTLCSIRVVGSTGSIFTGLDVTKEYYLSETVAGLIGTTVPSASGSIVLRVGQPLTDEKFVVVKGTRTTRL